MSKSRKSIIMASLLAAGLAAGSAAAQNDGPAPPRDPAPHADTTTNTNTGDASRGINPGWFGLLGLIGLAGLLPRGDSHGRTSGTGTGGGTMGTRP